MSELAPGHGPVSPEQIRSNLLRWMPLAVVVAGLDQATKAWVTSLLVHGERIQVLPFFAWVRWHNEGAAFSFLASAGGWQRAQALLPLTHGPACPAAAAEAFFA